MNEHAYIYAGPYVLTECPVGVVTEYTPKCSKDCALTAETRMGQFCHLCGSPVVLGRVAKEGSLVNLSEVTAAVPMHPRHITRSKDRLTQVVAWTPADEARRMPRTPTWNSRHHDFIEPITPETVSDEVRWLTLTYADEIAALKRRYQSVTVRWGIIGEVS